MREVSSKEYAEMVEDRIESAVEVALFDLFNEIAEHYGFPKQDDFGCFSGVYYEGYAATIRDEAVQLFEECGMDVVSDGRCF